MIGLFFHRNYEIVRLAIFETEDLGCARFCQRCSIRRCFRPPLDPVVEKLRDFLESDLVLFVLLLDFVQVLWIQLFFFLHFLAFRFARFIFLRLFFLFFHFLCLWLRWFVCFDFRALRLLLEIGQFGNCRT